jgi:hypothetical protein
MSKGRAMPDGWPYKSQRLACLPGVLAPASESPCRTRFPFIVPVDGKPTLPADWLGRLGWDLEFWTGLASQESLCAIAMFVRFGWPLSGMET